ncbi:MAG TPA: GGDEF domain-containing protein [Candidatus Angelobacter sp.]|nr:GGDEF domain-containing protein [Candidatus Angelobacter sp.]
MTTFSKLKQINITAWLGRQSRAFLISASVLEFSAVTALRYFTPPIRDVAVLFLVPVSFAAWFIAPFLGWLMALASAALLLFFEVTHSGTTAGALWWNFAMNLAMFSFFVFIFSEVRRLYRRERELSLRDPLTGLLNRRAFTAVVNLERQRMQRHFRPLSMVYIDMDDFKQVNDSRGHIGGDALLKTVADSMKNSLRTTDFLARLGGDEFVLLLPETPAEAASSAIAKMYDRLRENTRPLGSPVTCSIGVVTFMSASVSADEMIGIADDTMYRVKSNSKNRIECKVCS